MDRRFMPHCTVAILIEHAGSILMVEERDEEGRLVFGIPAGHVEARESILEAALREGREEIGVPIELESVIGIYDYVKDYETILRFCCRARLQGGPPAQFSPSDPDGDIVGVRWYARADIYAQRERWRTRLVGQCVDDFYRGCAYPLSLITTVSARREVV